MFNNSPYFRQIIYIGIEVLLNINIIIIIFKNNYDFSNRFIKILTLYILFLILPIMQNIIRLIVLKSSLAPTMCAPYIIPVIIYISSIQDLFKNKKMQKCLNYVGIILTFYLIYTYILMGESTYISIEKNYNQIHSQLIRVIDRIENDDNYSKEVKIKIVGGKDFREYIPIYDFAGLGTRVGFFGKVGEISSSYLKEEFGIPNELATNEEMEEIYKTDEYKKMKEFPDKESVKFINNVIVVKLESNEYSMNKIKQEN